MNDRLSLQVKATDSGMREIPQPDLFSRKQEGRSSLEKYFDKVSSGSKKGPSSERSRHAILSNKLSNNFGDIPLLAKAPTDSGKQLAVNAPDDRYEKEADALADKVCRISERSVIQRKCAKCEQEEEDEKVHRKPLSSPLNSGGELSREGSVTDRILGQRIHSARGQGNKMDESTNWFMSSRFGVDFSHVKIHTNSQAVNLSRSLNAKAFTIGSDVFFNEAQYQPASEKGKQLLAHELTHTIQQGNCIRRAPMPLDQYRRPLGFFPTPEQEEYDRVSAEIRKDLFKILRTGFPGTKGNSYLLKEIKNMFDESSDMYWLAMNLLEHGPETLWPNSLYAELHARATKNGWSPAEGPLGETAGGLQVDALYFPGKTDNRALIIGGVHGSELSGIEVVQILIDKLKNGPAPFYSVIVVPTLFPGNAAVAASKPAQIETQENVGRYTKGTESGPHSKDPNRQFPSLGKAYDPATKQDAKGENIEAENIMLLELIDRFRPTRIASVHSTHDLGEAGIYADPRADSTGKALGYESDMKLASTMANAAKAAGANAPGNKFDSKGNATNTVYPKDPATAAAGKKQTREEKKGISLGGWGTTAICDPSKPASNRPAMRVITIEVQTARRSTDVAKAGQAKRKAELEAHASVLKEIFLGPNEVEGTMDPCASAPTVQPKLNINIPGDKYEQEADTVAEKVVRMKDVDNHQVKFPAMDIQRKCSACEEEEDLSLKESGTGGAGNSLLEPYVHSLAGKGNPMDESQRSFFEPRFGCDFSSVRIHSDRDANTSAKSVNALAYTFGSHIVFAENQFSLRSNADKRLMAHELTHVLQSHSSARLSRQENKEEEKKETVTEAPAPEAPSSDSKPANNTGTNVPPAPIPQSPVTAGGHTSAPAGMAQCPDAPPRNIVVLVCSAQPSSTPPLKEKAELPVFNTVSFNGDADRAKFAKDLAQCRAERDVKEEVEKRFNRDVAAAKKKAASEVKEETDQAQKAMKGLDKEALAQAKDRLEATKKAGTKKIADAQAAITRQDIKTVTAELATKYESDLVTDYDDTIKGAFSRFGPGWLNTMQNTLDKERSRIKKEKSTKPKVNKGDPPPEVKTPEKIAAEVEAEMVDVRCNQKQWGLDRLEAISHAWAVGRREEVDFRTISQKAAFLKDFKPSYNVAEGDKVEIPSTLQPEEKARKGIAPELADFLQQLAADPKTPRFTASNRPGHGGGSWSGKGFSTDISISAGKDKRGFWQHSTAVEFLLAVNVTAKALGARWRVLYDDFGVAQEVNQITGSRNVEFMGVSTGGNLNWHGPDPLILHFHLDLEIPQKPAATP